MNLFHIDRKMEVAVGANGAGKKIRVLITGGAGYVGCTLTARLLEEGYNVVTYDSLLSGGRGILPFFANQGFEFVKGDIRDKESLRQAVKGADCIIHLAAIVDRKSTRLNSSHRCISYAVFCLKKK